MDIKEDSFHLGVKALLRNKEGQVLTLKFNKPLPTDLWDLPGGRIQKNESPLETLRREVYEETSIQAFTPIKPFLMALSPIRIPIKDHTVGLIFLIYECRLDQPPLVQLSHEHTAFKWVSSQELSTLLKPNFPSELIHSLSNDSP